MPLNVERPTSNAQRSMKRIAGGGARTHTTLRPLDFESSASANSATPASAKFDTTKRGTKLKFQSGFQLKRSNAFSAASLLWRSSRNSRVHKKLGPRPIFGRTTK